MFETGINLKLRLFIEMVIFLRKTESFYINEFSIPGAFFFFGN